MQSRSEGIKDFVAEHVVWNLVRLSPGIITTIVQFARGKNISTALKHGAIAETVVAGVVAADAVLPLRRKHYEFLRGSFDPAKDADVIWTKRTLD